MLFHKLASALDLIRPTLFGTALGAVGGGALPGGSDWGRGAVRGGATGLGLGLGDLLGGAAARGMNASPAAVGIARALGGIGGGFTGYRLGRKVTRTRAEKVKDQIDEAEKSAAAAEPGLSASTMMQLAGMGGLGLTGATLGGVGGAIMPSGAGFIPGMVRGGLAGVGYGAGGAGGNMLADALKVQNPLARFGMNVGGSVLGAGLGYSAGRKLTKTPREKLEEAMLNWYDERDGRNAEDGEEETPPGLPKIAGVIPPAIPTPAKWQTSNTVTQPQPKPAGSVASTVPTSQQPSIPNTAPSPYAFNGQEWAATTGRIGDENGDHTWETMQRTQPRSFATQPPEVQQYYSQQQQVLSAFPAVGQPGTEQNQKFVEAYNQARSSGQTPDMFQLANQLFTPSAPAAAPSASPAPAAPQAPAAPSPQAPTAATAATPGIPAPPPIPTAPVPVPATAAPQPATAPAPGGVMTAEQRRNARTAPEAIMAQNFRPTLTEEEKALVAAGVSPAALIAKKEQNRQEGFQMQRAVARHAQQRATIDSAIQELQREMVEMRGRNVSGYDTQLQKLVAMRNALDQAAGPMRMALGENPDAPKGADAFTQGMEDPEFDPQFLVQSGLMSPGMLSRMQASRSGLNPSRITPR